MTMSYRWRSRWRNPAMAGTVGAVWGTTNPLWTSTITSARDAASPMGSLRFKDRPRRGTGPAACPQAQLLEHVLPLLLGASGADSRRHLLLLLGGRQDGRHPEGLDPQLACPTHRVVEVHVLLL